MMMIAAAIALNVTIDLGPKKSSSSKAAIVTCHKGAVSYKFVGTPGTKFKYGPDEWAIPIEGWIEVVADKRASDYVLAGENLPVDVGSLDAFGTRTVIVPMPQPKGEQYAEARR